MRRYLFLMLAAFVGCNEDPSEIQQHNTSSPAAGTGGAIRAYITTHAGSAPVGALNRKTLVRMAMDARPNKAA